MIRTAVALLAICLPSQALAWNALGHKVACAIAWDQLDEPTRKRIADTIRRHPRFDEDFAKRLDDIDDDELVFQHAGTWPDIARGIRGPDRAKYDNPTWHYVNFPLFLGPERRINVNLETDIAGEGNKWNVLQATQFSAKVLASDEPPAHKALAYCWLAHLVADLHQPCHSTALFCDRFPNGDRGGNSIKTKQGGNLHSLWDNLLGRSHKPNNVKRIVYDLKQRKELWNIETDGKVVDWVRESHELAREFIYPPEIVEAVEQPGVMLKIDLPESYLKQAGSHAQARIVAAGLRLGAMLGEEHIEGR